MASSRRKTTSTRKRVSIDTVPLPERTRIGSWPTPEGSIRVTIPAQVGFNLKNLQKTIGNVMGQLGCPACCSGFDISFLNSDFVIDAKTLGVKSLR